MSDDFKSNPSKFQLPELDEEEEDKVENEKEEENEIENENEKPPWDVVTYTIE